MRRWPATGRKFQSPSLRGSGRFGAAFLAGPHPLWEFQSPSLRGSGRFDPALSSVRLSLACFNPLHCGAVVASRVAGGDPEAPLTFQSPSLRGSGRFPRRGGRTGEARPGFNPLHCGAVVASPGVLLLHFMLPENVSIPFIAGQWSLRARRKRNECHLCGFQSPSLRGSGRFKRPRPPGRATEHVSIPFIAGQWSLLVTGMRLDPVPRSLNPLHCGAVVASPKEVDPQELPWPSLNPLHCGAVVASKSQ